MSEDSPVVLPIELSSAQVRPIAYRIISKKHGLNLKSSALEVLAKFLGRHFGADWRGIQAEKSLDEISRRWKDEDRGIFVDGSPLSQVIKDWLNAETATQNTTSTQSNAFDWRQYFKVVNIKDQRRFFYDKTKKNFTLDSTANSIELPQIFSQAKSLTNVFSARYNILLDKLYRHEMFRPSSLAAEDEQVVEGQRVYTITPIKNLLGRSKGTDFFVFGLLEKPEDGPWTLYDSTSNIVLEFTEQTAFAPDHYYTNGSFVLCHGHFLGDCFQVVTLGVPPPEPRGVSQAAFGNIDFYGLNSPTGKEQRRVTRIERIDPSLQQILENEEHKMKNNKIVILGTDIFLDEITVVDSLRKTLLKLEKDPPIVLIVPGSFISQPFRPRTVSSDGRNAAQLYRDGMNALADIFQQCPRLSAESKVIIIPGPHDPWHSASVDLLPYFRLPSVFTGRVERAVKDLEFATNPTRLCYLSQEIYLFRANTGEKLRAYSLDTDAINRGDVEMKDDTTLTGKTAVNTPLDIPHRELDDEEERDADRAAVNAMIETYNTPMSEVAEATNDNNEFRRVMCTLLDQCTVSPFSMSKSPVMWEFDQAMSLSQWPTCFVLLDPTTPAAKQVYEDCNVMNPGKFYVNNKSHWLEFWPSSGEYKFMELL